MNSLTVLAYVKAPPQLQAVGGDKQVASFPVEIAAYKQEDPPMSLQASIWGELANEAMQCVQVDSYLVLTGRLRIEKNKPPELQVADFHRVSAPLDRPGVNNAILVGRAGRDPEVRYFESGNMVANLTAAVNRRSRDDEPDWFNLEIWGKQAQVAADYVHKGSLLGIIGSFKLDRWTDRTNGEERLKVVIRVDRLELLGSKRDGDGGGFASAPHRTGAASATAAPGDDEIPF
jgi:single-strand DNA-binding protein